MCSGLPNQRICEPVRPPSMSSVYDVVVVLKLALQKAVAKTTKG